MVVLPFAGIRREGPVSWLVQARLLNGPFDDPGLLLDFRFGRRAILFDLGDLRAVSSRELLRVSHAFVSHTHIDHFAGFDRLLRVCLHRPGPLVLVGPPDFVDRVHHRLRGITWNLLDETSADFCIEAMEFDGRLSRAARFRARQGFLREEAEPPALADGLVLEEENLRIEAAILDHGIPCLAFALREGQRVNVWRGALAELGLPVGPWLRHAKEAARRGEPDSLALAVPGHRTVSLGALRERAFRIGPGQAVVYVTDAAAHAANRDRIVALAREADELFIEAVFLDRDRPLATATRHLTAHDAGELARLAGARNLRVFHHSGRYLADPLPLAREAEEAFREGVET